MDVALVPEDRHRHRELPPQLAEELRRYPRHARSCHRAGGGSRARRGGGFRADGDGSVDGRDPVVPAPALEDGRLAARRRRAAHRRREHEPRLVEEHQVHRMAGPAEDLRQLHARLRCSMAASSRSFALFCGFWLVQWSRRLRILRTCSGWKRTLEVPLSISSATLAAVHRLSGPPPMGLGPLAEQALQFLEPAKRRGVALGRRAAWRPASQATGGRASPRCRRRSVRNPGSGRRRRAIRPARRVRRHGGGDAGVLRRSRWVSCPLYDRDRIRVQLAGLESIEQFRIESGGIRRT